MSAAEIRKTKKINPKKIYKNKEENQNQNENKTVKRNVLTVKVILLLIILVAIPVLFYNPDLSFGPFDVLRKDFFKTEIILSGYKFNSDDLAKAINNDETRLVKLYVRAGMNLNALTSTGVSPLCIASEKANLKMVSILMRGEINLMKANSSDGLTPVYCAIKGNSTEIMDKLVLAGASLTSRNEFANGISPLHYAVALGNDNIVSYLINSGARVNVTDMNGQTPLHTAIFQDNIVVLYILLNAGAKVNIGDNDGETPLTLAEESNKKEYSSLLSRYTE